MQENTIHLMAMDNIKLLTKNEEWGEKEWETLIHAVRLYSQNIAMKFSIENCVMLKMKSGKKHLTDGMELLNQDKIRTLGENETYKYSGISEADTINQVEFKDKIKKEYLWRTRKLLKTKLYNRNLIKGINTWAVSLVAYSGPFVKGTREEHEQMGKRIRKLMTMHKALPLRDDFDRCVMKRRRKVTWQNWRHHSHGNTMTRILHRKARRKTD